MLTHPIGRYPTGEMPGFFGSPQRRFFDFGSPRDGLTLTPRRARCDGILPLHISLRRSLLVFSHA